MPILFWGFLIIRMYNIPQNPTLIIKAPIFCYKAHFKTPSNRIKTVRELDPTPSTLNPSTLYPDPETKNPKP